MPDLHCTDNEVNVIVNTHIKTLETVNTDFVVIRSFRIDVTDWVVRAIHNFGAGDVLELDRHGGGSLLLPFNRDFVPKVDIANKTVTIAEPEDIEVREHRGIE